MLKSDVLAHFGSQQKLADALTQAGFPISQRAISGWPERVPQHRAQQIASIQPRKFKFDLSAYRLPPQQPAQ